jgi:hypothetical protein
MKFLSANLLLVACLIFTLGTAMADDSEFFGPPPKPAGAYNASIRLPANIKRVLLLPLACDEGRANLADDCQTLDPILEAELVKTKRFEVVSASSEMLHSCTGRQDWTGAEVLPANFFTSLENVYGCDAVMFCQLTTYHAYPPLAVGWRLKLVDVHTKKIIWAVDKIYDASNPTIAEDAQRFEKHQQDVHGKTRSLLKSLFRYADREPTSALDDQWAILNSPRYFSRYSLAELLKTLPER